MIEWAVIGVIVGFVLSTVIYTILYFLSIDKFYDKGYQKGVDETRENLYEPAFNQGRALGYSEAIQDMAGKE